MKLRNIIKQAKGELEKRVPFDLIPTFISGRIDKDGDLTLSSKGYDDLHLPYKTQRKRKNKDKRRLEKSIRKAWKIKKAQPLSIMITTEQSIDEVGNLKTEGSQIMKGDLKDEIIKQKDLSRN